MGTFNKDIIVADVKAAIYEIYRGGIDFNTPATGRKTLLTMNAASKDLFNQDLVDTVNASGLVVGDNIAADYKKITDFILPFLSHVTISVDENIPDGQFEIKDITHADQPI